MSKFRFVDCHYCGDPFYNSVNKKYCSYSCFREEKARNRKTRYNPPRNMRMNIYKQFDFCCICCGTKNEELKPLQLHHIDDNPRNDDPKNLVPLCVSCHRKIQNRHTSAESEKIKDTIRQFKNEGKKLWTG